jgi:hypothetical protein
MERFAQVVAVAAGVFFVGSGLWAFVTPLGFFEAAATFDPYNAHFIRDIGAFQMGLGAVLLLAVPLGRALTAGLGGVGIGSAFHAIGHAIDADLGGQPALDIPFFAVLTVLLLGGAWAAHRGGQPVPVAERSS